MIIFFDSYSKISLLDYRCKTVYHPVDEYHEKDTYEKHIHTIPQHRKTRYINTSRANIQS